MWKYVSYVPLHSHSSLFLRFYRLKIVYCYVSTTISKREFGNYSFTVCRNGSVQSGLAVFNIGERNKQICQFIRILDALSNWDDIRISKFDPMFKIILYTFIVIIILLIFDKKYCLEIFPDNNVMRKNLTEILNKKKKFILDILENYI